MAAGTKLNLVFNNSDGGTTSYTWNYAKSGATKANVVALGQAMITNTSILASKLVSLKSAKTVTTSENVYDLDNVSDLMTTPNFKPSIIDTGTAPIEGNPDTPDADTVTMRITRAEMEKILKERQ